MILDHALVLSSAQSLTDSDVSTHYADQLAAGDVLHGGDFILVVRVGTSFLGASSLQINLQTDDNSSFTSPTTLYTGVPIPAASLTADTVVATIKMLPLNLQRFFRINYVVAGGPFVAGDVDAFILTGIDRGLP